MADGATATQDVLPGTGQPSDGKSGPSGKVYTEAEVNARHSKLDKAIANLTRERDDVKTSLSDLQKRIDEIETAQVGTDPDALEQYRKDKELRRLREENKALQERKKEIEGEKALTEREKTAQRIATEYNVNIADLLLTDGSPEKMEALAARLNPKKVKGDSFDTGIGSGHIVGLDDLSSKELIRKAYSEKK